MAEGSSKNDGVSCQLEGIAAAGEEYRRYNRGRSKGSQENSLNKKMSKVLCHQILNAQKEV
jgi:hypothetical protein